MRALLRGLLDLLLPPSCVGCGAAGDALLCAACRTRLPLVARGGCALCQHAPARTGEGLCARCMRRASPLDACIAGAWFEADAAAWIRRYKYPPRGPGPASLDRARLRALAREAVAWRDLDAPDQVVPVPLHRRRLRQRGFNPATTLARELARQRSVSLAATALRRVRDTPSQTGLGRAKRRANVRAAFRAQGAAPARIWLVDDVVTTGATLEECARALRAAGARHIVALCAARTPLHPARVEVADVPQRGPERGTG